jgi:hypothetical protein
MQVSRDVLQSPETRPEGWDIPVYKLVLERCGIDFVLVPGCDQISGTLVRLAPVLAEDPGWSLAYADGHALLFVRNTASRGELLRRRGVPRRAAYENIRSIALRAGAGGHSRNLSGWLLSMAAAEAGLGNPVAAAAWLDRYEAAAPGDPYAGSLRARLATAAR